MIGKNDENEYIIADSSFYICFLSDIKRPEYLRKILNKLSFMISSCIIKEVSRQNEIIQIIKDTKTLELDGKLRFTDILKPFISEKQVEKGETEVIALAFILDQMNKLGQFIVDDLEPRNYIINNLNKLHGKMTGTVGFLEKCCCTYCVFNKTTGLHIAKLIDESKFRVNPVIIYDITKKIGEC